MTCDQWPIVWGCAKPPTATDEQIAAAISGAQTLLWSRTGRRLGLCMVVEQYQLPNNRPCGMPFAGGDRGWAPAGSSFDCCSIHLVQQPVQNIVSVTIGGVVVDPSSYWVEGSALKRVGAHWPSGSPHSAPMIEVAYWHGVPISDALWGLVGMAMGEVANELLVGMCGGACKLSSRAVAVTRAGVTVDLAPAAETADKGRLGLPLADGLIDSVNPGKLQQRSRVFSPDMARKSQTVTTKPGAVNQGGVSTIAVPVAYEGDPYSFDVTFPDATYLAGGTGSVDAEIKTDPEQPTADASFVPTINGATLTLTLSPVTLPPGRYYFDVSVGGVTYIRKTVLTVAQQVST